METNKKDSSYSKKSCGVFLGLLIAMVGTLFLGFNLGWLDTSLRKVVFSWQMLFVVFVIISLLKRQYLSAFCWTVLGAFFLLPRIAKFYPEALPGIDGNFASNYWPILLIFLGIVIILQILFGKTMFFVFGTKVYSSGRTEDGNRKFNKAAAEGCYFREVVFGGHDDIFLEPVFRGGKIEVVFGGVELDLRKTTLPEGDTQLNIEIVFGGVKLTLPDDWKVITETETVFGGVENKRPQVLQTGDARRLIIVGEVIFGGIEIR